MRNLQISVDSPLIASLRINHGVVERESRLLYDGLENHEIRSRKRSAHWAVCHSQNAQVLVGIYQATDHNRIQFKSGMTKAFQPGVRILAREKEWLSPLPDRPEQALSRLHRMKPHITF